MTGQLRIVAFLSCLAANEALKFNTKFHLQADPSKDLTDISLYRTSLNDTSTKFDELFIKLQNLVDKKSDMRVLHLHGEGEYGFDLMEIFVNKPAFKPVETLPNGWHYQKTQGAFRWGIWDFVNMLVKDLDQDKMQRLSKCNTQVSATPGETGGLSPGSQGVWMVVNAEKLSEERLLNWKGFEQNKVLVLGPGGKDIQSPTGKGRHMWIPGASLAFMSIKAHTPMDLVKRSDTLKFKEPQHDFATQHHSCKPLREKFFEEICKGLSENEMKCFALGACGKNSYSSADSRNNKANHNQPWRDDNSVERYKPYKFVEAFENSVGIPSTYDYPSAGYITEKIVPGFLAGAVPVFAGSEEKYVNQVFNPASFIYADVDNLTPTIDKMVHLGKNPEEYEAMVMTPAVLPEQMKRFFSWHPAVWAEYGDDLRQRILDNLLDLCTL